MEYGRDFNAFLALCAESGVLIVMIVMLIAAGIFVGATPS